MWQLNWLNEGNPNDKEILINGNNIIRINKLEGGREREREREREKADRQTDRVTWLYTLRNRLKPKGGEGTEIVIVLSNDVTLVHTCVNFKTNQLGVGC